MRFDARLGLSQAFRPFFPLAAMMTAMSVMAWIFSLARLTPLHANPTLWHAHEMLYGFAVAIILGFTLTAVENWTGQKALGTTSLGCLIALWVAARTLAIWPSREAQLASSIFDVPVLFVGAGLMARILIRTHNRRNMMFIPFMLGLAVLNLLIHYSLWSGQVGLARMLLHGSAWLVGFLMVFMGGRVIPFFTGRRLGYTPRQFTLLNWVSTLSALACALAFPLEMPVPLLACAVIATLSTGVRWLLWSPWRTFREPMLWILHIGYGWLVAAYSLIVLVELDVLAWPRTAAIHALLAGGLGGLGLGMISRVSLGHSGRPIVADRWITTSFWLVILAGVFRMSVYVSYANGAWLQRVSAAVCWSLAFCIFAARYVPWLWTSQPQLTGRPSHD